MIYLSILQYIGGVTIIAGSLNLLYQFHVWASVILEEGPTCYATKDAHASILKIKDAKQRV
jgi:hypothetical protein